MRERKNGHWERIGDAISNFPSKFEARSALKLFKIERRTTLRKRIMKGAALLLSVLLSVTTLPGGAAFASLLPLEEDAALTLNLTALRPFELKAYPVSDLLRELNIAPQSGDAVMWVKKSYPLDGKDDFRIAYPGGVIDLSPENRYNNTYYLELIVGAPTQLEASNKRYIAEVTFNNVYENLYDFTLYTQDDETREAVLPLDVQCSTYDDPLRYNISVPSGYDYDAEYYLGISFGADLAREGYDVKVYRGQYDTAAEALASGADVTDAVLSPDMTARDAGLKDTYYYSRQSMFTAVFSKSGTVVSLDSFWLNVEPSNTSVYAAGIWADNGSGGYTYAAYDDNSEDGGDDEYIEITTYKLYKEYPASAQYRVAFVCHHNHKDATLADGYVKKAVVGHYDTEEETDAAGATDIKADLFPDDPRGGSGGGYLANYGGAGVDFTVFFTDGTSDKRTVRAVNGTQSRDAADSPYRADTYLEITGAYAGTGAGGNTWLNCYRVSSNDDSYYANGYQTLLVSGAAVNAVKPIFNTRQAGIVVYANGEKQESEKTVQNFSTGAVPYSVFPENSLTTALKNYSVSFVGRETGGAKLFVNGPNGAASETKNDENTREIFLNDFYEYRHDIFIANVGDARLTDLSVKLEDAQHVKLDDYWTLDGNDQNTSLAAFTTTSKAKTYGDLPNVAKIRLLPDGDGAVDGKLTISGGGASRVVYLTGIAGDPKIITGKIKDAVKYVPYSFLLQTNSMYDWIDVSFSRISGRLPDGVELRPNGEVYGVPRETGTFTFEVRADFDPGAGASGDLDFTPAEAEFTLEVLDNTDTNVDASTDPGYEVTQRIPTITTLGDYVFESAGEFPRFVDLWIDGDKLAGGGVDYDANSGSTVITVRAQTFNRYGAGTHTLAAEFREGEGGEGELKRAAQNYTLNLSDWSGGNGGNNGSGGTGGDTPGGSDASGTATQPAQDGAAAAATSPADNFTDIRGHWAESYIRTVVERELFNGVSATRFDPDGTLSRAMLVTVLWRLAGRAAPGGGVSFSDAGAGTWYSDAIGWAAESGIVQGYPDGRFGTGDDIGREQIATILFRYAEQAEMDVSGRADLGDFSDGASVPAWAADAMSWAVYAGLIRGRDDGALSPIDDATRAELATSIVRFTDIADASSV
jgi:hypothetical protein